MSQAGPIDVIGGNPSIPTEFVTDNGTAVPIANVLEILGTSALAGSIPVETTGSGNTVTIEVQTSQAIVGTDATKIGLAAFDSSAFSVDANGFVTLNGGGGATTNIDVDAFTPPGTDPVVPNAGNIIMTGAQVATGTIGTNVIRTNSLAANTVTIEIQRSTAVAATDITKNGVSHFNSTQFTVDANGFVELAGAGLAIDSIGTQTGTNPIVPTAGGLVTINGAVVAAGTNPVRSDGTGANTMAIEVQISQALAATDATKIGLCNFDSAKFTVDANGFVSTSGTGIGQTITGDSGGALSPTAGNWNILGASTAAGTSPVTTSGAVSTLTVNVQKSQAIASTDATKVGLANFDSAAFDVDANGFVQLNGGGIATTSFDVQASTVPGTDPVVPSAAGVVIVNGAVVANHSVVLETHSRAANTYNLEVQYATSAAATDGTKSGVAHFDSTDFSVDASGFVTLNGAGAGQTITGDSGGALAPTAGNWNILGLSGSKTSGSVSTLTIKSPPYADVAGAGSVTLNSGSFATNAITLTTPVTAGLADGDLLEFVATNGVLVIQLAATQVAHLGSAATTVAGTITGSATGDSISLRYQASTNDWWATSSIGIWVLA